VEELVLSYGNLKPNLKKLDCETCQCDESICVRELKEQLRKLIGREISVFVKNESALIIGTLIKVDCGTVVINGFRIDDILQELRPTLVKICDITGFMCGNFLIPVQNTSCFPNLNTAEESSLVCSCPCTENDCVSDLRQQLINCIGKNLVINIIGQTLAGPLLRVNCGSILFGDFIGTGFVFYVPLCQIQYVYAITDSAFCNLTPSIQIQETSCSCECINNVCIDTLRKELERCIRKQVDIYFECFNPTDISRRGTVQKVNSGTVLVLIEGTPVLIPLCQISTVINVNQTTPILSGSPDYNRNLDQIRETRLQRIRQLQSRS
jgi:hypothetical protein